ncbi:hypothetical protein B0T26DRAFT_673596 [Lasiosphaeria miniovina]|uniref:Uncharacterized protein n=1 Tax=Lasiosphaeria miniovina TaxID=1954250 RepID=A0AA40DZU6_9PEZI|nr:uncharacterized protein B0T26DRAFT_673596 [Lasiosphaeria miniovina]KAK0721820.1 hypothetical protein B0T26DRAFT_673596 [Lasiosphaeria miniovina]
MAKWTAFAIVQMRSALEQENPEPAMLERRVVVASQWILLSGRRVFEDAFAASTLSLFEVRALAPGPLYTGIRHPGSALRGFLGHFLRSASVAPEQGCEGEYGLGIVYPALNGINATEKNPRFELKLCESVINSTSITPILFPRPSFVIFTLLFQLQATLAGLDSRVSGAGASLVSDVPTLATLPPAQPTGTDACAFDSINSLVDRVASDWTGYNISLLYMATTTILKTIMKYYVRNHDGSVPAIPITRSPTRPEPEVTSSKPRTPSPWLPTTVNLASFFFSIQDESVLSNQAIRELPVVTDILMLETPPPSKLTFVAAEHIELCSSVGRAVSDAQGRTKNSLDQSNGQIASAQQEIADTNRMSSKIASQARRHDENAEGNSILFWTTFWIPIVNVVTIRLPLPSSRKQRLAASCRETAQRLTAEIVTKSAEKVSLKAIRYGLDSSLARLNLAEGEANERARHAAGFRD